MTKTAITDRLDFLIQVQKWTKENKWLGAGPRICISQERAALMRCLDQINENENMDPDPRYRLPPVLEQKVQHLYGVMQQEWRKRHQAATSPLPSSGTV